ncbi:MAG: hypothetical protein ABFS37_09650 [Acidobacteriota bacterium]
MFAVKTIGKSGQIALGKEFAGKQVLVDRVEPGVWVVKLGEFVPDSERWLFHAPVSGDLDEAIRWAEANPPQETDFEALETKGAGR